MHDHILIYVIVVLNALCQLMLIWRLKSLGRTRLGFMICAASVPLVTATIMRLAVANGIIQARLTEQSHLEQVVTQVMGMLLIGGPWLVTAVAILYRRGRGSHACPST